MEQSSTFWGQNRLLQVSKWRPEEIWSITPAHADNWPAALGTGAQDRKDLRLSMGLSAKDDTSSGGGGNMGGIYMPQ